MRKDIYTGKKVKLVQKYIFKISSYLIELKLAIFNEFDGCKLAT